VSDILQVSRIARILRSSASASRHRPFLLRGGQRNNAFWEPTEPAKTTTLRSICKHGSLYRCHPVSTGLELSTRSTEKLVRLGIAHVPQGARGPSREMTVEENLRSRRDQPERRQGCPPATSIGCTRHFPKLKERRSQQAGTLSGGEQQMLAVASCSHAPSSPHAA